MTWLPSIEQHDAHLARTTLLDRYLTNRARSRALFDLVADAAYYSRPIALRHPLVFYEGHLPAFSFNTLVRKALGAPRFNPDLEDLFARGIDPAIDTTPASQNAALHWPTRDDVRAFADQADRLVIHALSTAELDRPGDAFLDHAEAVFTILEHEEMHQETLLYMWHRLPIEHKRAPNGYAPKTAGPTRPSEWVTVPGSRATLGRDRDTLTFGWDNERPAHVANVSAFKIERFNVTNERFLEFVEAGGYQHRAWWTADDWRWLTQEARAHPLFWEREGNTWLWRGMFQRVPLPLSWPVYVSHAEASAFARWRGARLPTEAEFQVAAYGSPSGEREHPWGHDAPDDRHGVFDFKSWDPEAVGTHPDGASAWGVEDLVGNGWEWTSTTFAPFAGFQAMPSYPEYSADFFDGHHYVMKGASPATAASLLRPTFRNWFRPHYPYVYATFRCVTSL